MTILEMFQQSAILTLLGMAVVFAFLWIMIIAVNFINKIIRKMGLSDETAQPEFGTVSQAPETVPPAHIAAVSAAVAEYENAGMG